MTVLRSRNAYSDYSTLENAKKFIISNLQKKLPREVNCMLNGERQHIQDNLFDMDLLKRLIVMRHKQRRRDLFGPLCIRASLYAGLRDPMLLSATLPTLAAAGHWR